MRCYTKRVGGGKTKSIFAVAIRNKELKKLSKYLGASSAGLIALYRGL